MKKLGINIILVLFFVSLISLTLLPLISELEFAQAKRLEIGYRWSKAKESYSRVLNLNTLNAEFFARTGDFLLRQSAYKKNEKDLLVAAKQMYQRACQLNIRYGYYRFLLGRVQLELGDTKGAIDNFKMAAVLDPYNFRTNYLMGLNMLSFWNSLNDEDKDFALARLRHAVKVRPYFLINVCQQLLFYTRDFNMVEKAFPQNLTSYKNLYNFVLDNNLWQYRQAVLEKVNFYREKEESQVFEAEKVSRLNTFQALKSSMTPLSNLITPRNWRGVSETGMNFKDGNMYWSGTMNVVVSLSSGTSEISIQARGTPVNGAFPYIIVELDGELIGETTVDSQDWKQYSFTIDSPGGTQVLSITFLNDGANKFTGEDRNLHIGETKIISNETQSL